MTFTNVICLLFFTVGLKASDKMAPQETTPVSFSSATKTLEGKLKRNSDVAEAHLGMARLFSLAWTMKTDQLIVEKLSDFIFLSASVLPNTEKFSLQKDLNQFIEKSIFHYRKSLEVQSQDQTKFELAISLMEKKKPESKPEILQLFREVHESSWQKDQNKHPGGVRVSLLMESALQLSRLLDPEKDAAEIQKLKFRINELSKRPRHFF